jgi:hypothetical protein
MSLERITSALNQGGAHLGDIVYWTLAEARIDRSTLENIWAGARLAPEHLPDPPTAEKAFKTAAREAALGQPDRLVRLGLENEAEIVFAVVAESRDDSGNVNHSQETRVMLDRKAETVSSDVPGHDLAGVINTRFGEMRSTHTPDDIRRAMMKDPRRLCGGHAARPRRRLLGARALRGDRPAAPGRHREDRQLAGVPLARPRLCRREQDPGRRGQARHRGRARGAEGRGGGVHGLAPRQTVHAGAAS